MKINFKNGSSIESIGNIPDVNRSQRGEVQITKMREQIEYWQRNPDEYIEFVTGVKLSLYQRVWIKLELMRRKIL